MFFLLLISTVSSLQQDCFYCSSQSRGLSPHYQSKADATFGYNKLNIIESCRDICSEHDQKHQQLNEQNDCFQYANISDTLYLYDESVQTCFNFDPRDAQKRPLPNILDFEKSPIQRRELQNQVCSDNTNCFDCSVQGSLCKWENEESSCKSSDESGVDQVAGQQWFYYYSGCADEKSLCNIEIQEEEKVFTYKIIDSTGVEEIPLNYYCNFTISLKTDIVYGVEIFRYNRYDIEEFVDIVLRVHPGKGQEDTIDYISDKEIRENSVYEQNSKRSSAQLMFRNDDPTTLEFHTINIGEQRKEESFKIVVMEDYNMNFGAFMGYQTMFVSLFCMVVCCSCGIKFLRFIILKIRRCRQQQRMRNRNIDEDDQDDYRDRGRNNRPEQNSRSQVILNVSGSNRVDPTNQRAQSSLEHNNKIMENLTHLTYSKEFAQNDEFGLEECVFCMDQFLHNIKIIQIPMCKHFFHPKCLFEWFQKNVQQSQTRKCPICNQQVTMDLLKEHKK